MPEIRVDPLTGLRTIIAADRSTRPGGGIEVAPPEPIDPATDPFAEGHEDRTPPELSALRDGGGRGPDSPGWTVRVVPNLYPALVAEAPEPPRSAKPSLFTALAASGEHEVIVNAPDPVQSLADLSEAQVIAAVDVWRDRMRFHDDASYQHLIVNERREGGASQPHTHAQLYAMQFVPAAIARERERFGAYAVQTMGGNLLADLLQEEVRMRERIVGIDDEAVLLCPYGARSPFQMMLVPRRPRLRFQDEGASGAALLREGLLRLKRRFGSSPPLNLWVRTAPQGAEHFCWRIDVLPRLTNLAGLELGAGVHLNSVSPEQSAEELRGCSA